MKLQETTKELVEAIVEKVIFNHLIINIIYGHQQFLYCNQKCIPGLFLTHS